MMDKEKETKFLDGLYDDYITSDDSPYLRNMRNLEMRTCKRYMRPNGAAMELGCEIWYMTSLISPHVKSLDVVEGSQKFIEKAKERKLGNVIFYNMLFEEITAEERYDYIFASHVIEHLIAPRETLQTMYRALKPGGRVFVVVPNALAASRQLAQKMGIIGDLYGLTPNDARGGHRRVYDKHSIMDEICQAGFTPVTWQGLLFKPFCDEQFDKLLNSGFLTQNHMDGLEKLGYENPDLCGAIFIVGEK